MIIYPPWFQFSLSSSLWHLEPHLCSLLSALGPSLLQWYRFQWYRLVLHLSSSTLLFVACLRGLHSVFHQNLFAHEWISCFLQSIQELHQSLLTFRFHLSQSLSLVLLLLTSLIFSLLEILKQKFTIFNYFLLSLQHISSVFLHKLNLYFFSSQSFLFFFKFFNQLFHLGESFSDLNTNASIRRSVSFLLSGILSLFDLISFGEKFFLEKVKLWITHFLYLSSEILAIFPPSSWFHSFSLTSIEFISTWWLDILI